MKVHNILYLIVLSGTVPIVTQPDELKPIEIGEATLESPVNNPMEPINLGNDFVKTVNKIPLLNLDEMKTEDIL